MVTSIDNEGTAKGFDIELTRKIAQSVPIPVIASGGAGSVSHVHDAVAHGKADAVSIASVLHYNYVRSHVRGDDGFDEEGNIEFLRRGGGLPNIEDVGLPEIKTHLVEQGIPCRYQ